MWYGVRLGGDVALVERTVADGVATLVLSRPERRNALSNALIDALIDALDDVAADPDVRVVVLTGAGVAFCAGGDLADGLGANRGFLDAHEGRGRFVALLQRLPSLKQPVVAAVNGDAMGGGLGLVAACDLVVADPAARLGTPEIKLGLFPWIILAALQRVVPRKALFELALTGGHWTADRGVALGLVNHVSPPGESVAVAQQLARTIASRSPAIVAWGKRAFYQAAEQDYDDALAYLHAQLTLNLLTEDAAEGVGAFLQKREPQWKGR